jgi:hypothetical protein
MKSNRTTKSAKTEPGLLLNVARTIGSTLGTLAAKTDGRSKHSRRAVVAKKTRSNKIEARKRRRA